MVNPAVFLVVLGLHGIEEWSMSKSHHSAESAVELQIGPFHCSVQRQLSSRFNFTLPCRDCGMLRGRLVKWRCCRV